MLRRVSPRRKGRCAFCAFEGRLSKEEIWPRWARPYIRDYDTFGHAVSSSVVAVPNRGVVGHIRRKSVLDGLPARTLRVVCAPCNNRWMSRLQKRAQPVLTPLFSGDWSNLGGVSKLTPRVVPSARQACPFDMPGIRDNLYSGSRRTGEVLAARAACSDDVLPRGADGVLRLEPPLRRPPIAHGAGVPGPDARVDSAECGGTT